MRKNHQNRQCLICLEDRFHEESLYHIFYQPTICITCLQSFKVIEQRHYLKGYPITILYAYNDFFKKVLFQYKGQYDYALKDAFLNPWIDEFKKKYQNHTIVIIPSSKQDNQKRGFCPNEMLVKSFSSTIFYGIYKNSTYKQAEQKNRKGIKKVLEIENGESLTNKKIVLFDDVITSANTVLATLSLLEKYQPKSIEILVLASGQITTLFTK